MCRHQDQQLARQLQRIGKTFVAMYASDMAPCTAMSVSWPSEWNICTFAEWIDIHGPQMKSHDDWESLDLLSSATTTLTFVKADIGFGDSFSFRKLSSSSIQQVLSLGRPRVSWLCSHHT